MNEGQNLQGLQRDEMNDDVMDLARKKKWEQSCIKRRQADKLRSTIDEPEYSAGELQDRLKEKRSASKPISELIGTSKQLQNQLRKEELKVTDGLSKELEAGRKEEEERMQRSWYHRKKPRINNSTMLM